MKIAQPTNVSINGTIYKTLNDALQKLGLAKIYNNKPIYVNHAHALQILARHGYYCVTVVPKRNTWIGYGTI